MRAEASASARERSFSEGANGRQGAYFFPGINTHVFETKERSFNDFNRRNCVFT